MAQAVLDASAAAEAANGRTSLTVIDCDVHPYPNTIHDLTPFMSDRWVQYVKQSGFAAPPGTQYPKGYEMAARRDAWPPNGLRPGADPDFVREQLLDEWDMQYGILTPLYAAGHVHNDDFSIALARAVNEWQRHVWLDSDERWRSSITVTPQIPEAAAEEIRRCGKDGRFVQVILTVRGNAPYGKRHYYPLFEAAADMDLPVGIHFGGWGNHPITATGWPSYYLEDHTGMTQAFEAQVLSLVSEGIFERLPNLRIALIEGGFSWMPSLMWRFDKNYKGLKEEVPWLRKLPSEYILEHFRMTTQPMDEPPNPQHLLQIFDMIGRDDFLMFATDYPHWDFDAPDRALPSVVRGELRRKIMADNATAFYDFERA